jgi:hypothetical protein
MCAGLESFAKIPRRQFNWVGFRIAVIKQSRGTIDPKVMLQRLPIQIFTGEADALSLCDFMFEPVGVEDIAG